MPTPITYYVGVERGDVQALLYQGPECREQMQEILQEQPACRALAEKLWSFFGETLILSIWPTEPDAGIVTYTCKYPDRVHIKLGLKSGRLVEAFTHELLHAELLRAGFPRPSADLMPDATAEHHFSLYNIVQHEQMLPLFEALGLAPAAFLGVKEALTEEDLINALNRRNITAADCLLQWYGDLQYTALTGDKRYTAWIEPAWWRVEQRFEGCADAASEMLAWFDRGEYTNPPTFEAAYGKLSEIVGLPPIPHKQWFRVVVGANGVEQRWNE